jgi:hypothetical protein
MAPPKSSLALDSGTDEVARCAESLSVARGGGLVSDVNGQHQLDFFLFVNDITDSRMFTVVYRGLEDLTTHYHPDW